MDSVAPSNDNDESMDVEHDNLESGDIGEFLPTPLTDLNSTTVSLELSTELTSELAMNNDPIVKDSEEHILSDVEKLVHKHVDEVDEQKMDKSIEIWEPDQNDVLTGRGANINLHPGNQKFRALCYAHKAIFDVANHAAKKRIATEIWTTCQKLYSSRFLAKQRSNVNGPWIQQDSQKAILKAAQTIRDYQRPDRILHRTSSPRRKNINNTEGDNIDDSKTAGDTPHNDNKKRRIVKSATPMDHVMIPQPPQEPLYENPDGVETNDVLCGRGAFVNGHYGNKYLRELAMARKCEFDAGNYTEKRKLATEIVTIIKELQPPGRFLTLPKMQSTNKADTGNEQYSMAPNVAVSNWEEVGLDKAIMKACQVMRDIDRADRKYRVDRKASRLNRLQALSLVIPNNDGTTDNSDGNHAVDDNDTEQKCVLDVINDDDDTLQSQQQEQLEQQDQDIGVDNNKSINTIINEVVDSIDMPLSSNQESV